MTDHSHDGEDQNAQHGCNSDDEMDVDENEG